MATVSSSHTPDTPSLHITHEQGASHVVEISNNGTDYILELNQNVAANNIVVNGDGEGDYQLVVTQSTDDFNVVIGGGIPDYFEISNLPTLGTAAAQNVEYFATAAHTHAISEVVGLQAAIDAAALSGEDNVQSDWQETNSAADSFILNKPVLFDGQYGNLTGLPTLFDGDYNSLSNLPTLFDGAYTSLTGLPTLFDGDYNSLTNLPTLFDGAYASLSGLPTLFDGAYSSLTGAPTIPTNNNELTNGEGFITDYTVTEADVTDHEAALSIAYSQLTSVPTTFTPSAHTHSASEITDFDTEVSNNSSVAANTSKVTFPGFGTTTGTALEGDTALFSGVYNDLTSKPTLFDGDYNSLTNLPTLFDGAYGSLSGTPTLGTAAAAATGDFAAASHTHVIADVTGLQTALDNAGEDNVQADWDETDTGADAFILNKPTVPSGIDDLSDVDTTTVTASTGDVLRWSGTVWAPDAPASGGTQSDWDETDAADPAFILNKPTAVADLEHNYVRVLLPSSHLTGGGSEIDFDANSKTQVTGFTSDETVGSGLTFASNQFTAGNDGLYTFNASAEFLSTVTQRPAPTLHFRVNGTEVEGKSLAYVRQSNVLDEATANLTRTFNLTSGDTVQVWFQNQGVTGAAVVTGEQFLFEGYSHDVTVIGVDGVIGDDNVQSDWNQTDTGADSFILNKPTITSFSGDYDDLTNKPTLFSEDYNDLSNLPTLVTSANGLSDVDTATSAPTVGDVLEWDGSNWVPSAPSGGGAVYTFSVTGGRTWGSGVHDRWMIGSLNNGLVGDSDTQDWEDFNPELFDSSNAYFYAINGSFIPTACTKIRVVGFVMASDSNTANEDLDIGLFRMTSYTDGGNAGTGDFFHTESTTFAGNGDMRLFDTGEISQTFASGDSISVFFQRTSTTQTSGSASMKLSYTIIVTE